MPGFVAPSAQTNDTLKAVALALKLMPRKMRNDLNREVRKLGNDQWRPIVDSYSRNDLDRKVLAKGARVKPGNPLVLTAASSKRALSGGLVPNEDAGAIEFGTKQPEKVTEYARAYKGGASHNVRRHTKRQLPRRSKGRVIYAAAGEIAPRITSMWVQTIVRAIYKAHEGES